MQKILSQNCLQAKIKWYNRKCEFFLREVGVTLSIFKETFIFQFYRFCSTLYFVLSQVEHLMSIAYSSGKVSEPELAQ